MLKKIISYFKSRKSFKEGDILICTKEEYGVHVEKGEEVTFKEYRNSNNYLDIEVIPEWYVEKTKGQYACSKNFKLKTRPQK